jgi:histidinol dehydrogenase
MKILNSNNKNFDQNLDNLLLQRKKKVQSNSVSVSSIIKDVRKNGDKALVKYEKRFNKNTIIVPSQKQITNSIKSLDKKVKQAIDIAYNRIYKFHSLQKFKNISYVDKYKNKLEYKYIPLEVRCNLCTWFNSLLSIKCINECYSSNCCRS